ncbi:hypothetical protein HY412_01410 [Candidatus Kaiserbacteria bacterium]|nr:hypothetical protein [Candidatus Kaiserbacteria bacterium]
MHPKTLKHTATEIELHPLVKAADSANAKTTVDGTASGGMDIRTNFAGTGTSLS